MMGRKKRNTKLRVESCNSIKYKHIHINDLTFPSVLFGLLIMIILVRKEKASFRSPRSRPQSLEELMCSFCYRNE